MNAWMPFCRRAVAALLIATAAPLALAHKASDAYLQLRVDRDGTAKLRADIALRDLDLVLDLDADADGRLTWGEVRRQWPAIEQYVDRHLDVPDCRWSGASRALERRIDGVYAAVTRQGRCTPGVAPSIRYTALADVDPTHRGIARVDVDGLAGRLAVLDPTRPMSTGTVAHAPSAGFLVEGIRHILGGYDHVLFLLCLLLPSVMRRTGQGWQPVSRLGDALWPVLGIVTSFTVAHSITLGLAACGLVTLPPRLIEPAIAVTIVLAALDNLWPVLPGRRAWITFVFGLVHGFGFAGVLGELNLSRGAFAWALLQFNVGLELGQMLVVASTVGLLYFVRQRGRYPRWVIGGGSVAALLIGVLWFAERTANVSLLPI